MDLAFPKSSTDNNGLIRADQSIVSKIEASSVESGTTKYVSNLISYSSTYWWCSDPIENSYFNIEFKIPIYVFNYSFDVYSWGNPEAYPLSWNVTGTRKGATLKISEVDSSGLNNYNTIKTFKTTKKGPFSSLRFTMTGVNQLNRNHFCLAKFDIFGYYGISNILCKTCLRKRMILYHILSYIFLICT